MADATGLPALPRVRVGRALVHQIDLAAAADVVCVLTSRAGQDAVVTPNISHVALLERSRELREAYAAAALVVPDGWPVAMVMGLLGGRAQQRVNGTELVLAVAERAAALGLTVGFAGGHANAAEAGAQALTRQHPALLVRCTEPLPKGFDRDDAAREAAFAGIREAAPDVLFLGLGAPKQEILATTSPLAGVVVCIGSSLELIGGVRRRAPASWRRAKLEWLYRIIQEPRRLLPRYLRDAPVFVIVVARQWLRSRKRQTP